MRFLPLTLAVCLVGCTSPTDYSPKPRGYLRLEPEAAVYQPLSIQGLPYTFSVSQQATAQLPPPTDRGERVTGLNLVYPTLHATLYCSYLPITPATRQEAMAQARELVARQVKDTRAISEKSYADPDKQLYASLFLLAGESASPIQFMVTDSLSHLFRGALYFECTPNVDSLAPVTQYLRDDIVMLIQSFTWTPNGTSVPTK